MAWKRPGTWLFVGTLAAIVSLFVASDTARRAAVIQRRDAELAQATQRAASLAERDTLIVIYRNVDSLTVREIGKLRREISQLRREAGRAKEERDELEVALEAQARIIQRIRDRE